MKSNEIIPEEIVDEWSTTHKGVIKHLEDQGYELLGKGVDQTAFLEPGTGYVLKVFGTQSSARAPHGKTAKPTFSRDHMMFFKWAEFCNKNSDNPFLPKFSGFESFYWKGKVYLQIRQERLHELDDDVAFVLETMADDAEYQDSDSFEILESAAADYPGAFRALKNTVGKRNLLLLVDTMLRLARAANRNNWTFDLHSKNFMSRGNKNFPVIVDPWVA